MVKSSLAEKHPELTPLWGNRNKESPADFTPSSKKKVWWQCEIGHEWLSAIHNVSRGSRCPFCSGREAVPGVNDLKTLYPALISEWHEDNSILASSIKPKYSKKVLWLCSKCNHKWEASPADRTRGRGCPACRGLAVVVGVNDLATTHPELATQWHPDNIKTAQEVTRGSKYRALWACEKGHTWRTLVEKRTRPSGGTGCPTCVGKIILKGYNDLQHLHPSLAEEWAPTNECKADEVSLNTHKKYTWLCKKDSTHVWEASPHARVQSNSGCPICSNRKDRDPTKILGRLNPSIVSEWIGPVSGDFRIKAKSWWRCAVCSHTWSAMFDNRMYGSGCPKCSKHISIGEQEIVSFVESTQVGVLTSDRGVLRPKELDVLIPSKKIAIEFNGVYWHSEDAGRDKKYHREKWEGCLSQGIQLLTIWQDEWETRPALVKRMLARKLGVSTEPKVPARKTKVVSVTKAVAVSFLKENHIQGAAAGSYYLGLEVDKELVAVCVLKRQGSNLTLERYSTNCMVVGGHSKIIAWVQKNLDFEKIVTFADLCVSDGSLYEKTGWTRDKELAPDYKYVVGSQRVHKFNYRLKRFREDPSLLFEEGLTERQLAELNGIPRIWDCGKIRYVMEKIK